MNYAIFTDKGKYREKNEDNYLVKQNSLDIFAVADGMGGHQAGEVASELAINYLNNYLFEPAADLLPQIKTAIKEANKQILNFAQGNPAYQGMGTTLTMGIISHSTLYIGHVGDSRIYLYRDLNLVRLTRDHSLVNELLEQKKITYKEAFNHPQKNIITQALGTSLELDIEAKMLKLQAGDYLLFCTDGLTDLVPEEEISLTFQRSKNLQEISNLLGNKALDNGGHDNITLIVYKMG